MKEIKFVSHIPRNAVLLFIYYAAFVIANNFITSIQVVIESIVAITLVYTPVYFINDFFDKEEDSKNKKYNLFLTIKSQFTFWSLGLVLLFLGIVLSFSINPQTMWLIIYVYIFNGLYSIPPFRFRNILFVREITLFIIYIIKGLLILKYLSYPTNHFSLSLIVLLSITGAYSLTIYKRYLKASKTAEYFFGALFYISLFLFLIKYPSLTALFLPIAPFSLHLALTNKNKQVSLGLYEVIYLIWGIIVFKIMG